MLQNIITLIIIHVRITLEIQIQVLQIHRKSLIQCIIFKFM